MSNVALRTRVFARGSVFQSFVGTVKLNFTFEFISPHRLHKDFVLEGRRSKLDCHYLNSEIQGSNDLLAF